jgi:sodium pump decarboxylase gamma subunit
MIIDGLLISAIGIGMVFTIFIVLIFLMNITSAIVAFLDKKFPVQTTPEVKPAVAARNAGESDEALIAIAIAAVVQNEKEKSALIKR